MKKLAALTLIVLLIISLTACGGEKEKKQIANTKKQDICTYIEDYINTNVSSGVYKTISKITATATDDKKVKISVRVVLAGGFYIPQANREIYPLATAALSEKQYTLERLSIDEYSESSSAGIDSSTLIHWQTDDGESGVLVDGRKKDNTPLQFTIEELFNYFGVNYISDGYVSDETITLVLSSGKRAGIYTGNIENGLPNGHGSFASKNTSDQEWIYTGNWKDGHMEGTGETTWTEFEEKHIGNYSNDLPNGKGQYYTKGVLTFEGDFKDGEQITNNAE